MQFQSSDIIRILVLTVTSFLLAMAFTPIYTHFAFKYKWWKKARTHSSTSGEATPIVHSLQAAKHARDFPTMAGIVAIATVVIVTLILNLSRNQTWLPLFAFFGAGMVGLVDDYLNIRGSSNRAGGLRSGLKFMLILGIAVIGALYFYFKLDYSMLHVPAVGDFNIGFFYIPLFALVVISTANAVNITDGLDGLAGGLLSLAFGAFAVIAMVQGNYGIAGFCAAMIGATLAYTWFNIFPARFLMGDSGAFALGTALGVVAMLTDSVFVLPIIGIVFVVEAGSSLIQIFSKKFFKRKIFLSAPVHHHLQAIGWPETKITMRFWVIGAVAAVLGIVIGIMGGGVR
ncbi:MAG: phospho-N-acetylmuramoyl-pentapeptide-transferase [Patescibacteria group bacterium]|nr:phospho-N-acetylmuramoyl-pentapeptide-transferase [Patescibacteria group bacterium]